MTNKINNIAIAGAILSASLLMSNVTPASAFDFSMLNFPSAEKSSMEQTRSAQRFAFFSTQINKPTRSKRKQKSGK